MIQTIKGNYLNSYHLRIRPIFNHYGMEILDDVTNMQFLEKKHLGHQFLILLLTMLAMKIYIYRFGMDKNGFENVI